MDEEINININKNIYKSIQIGRGIATEIVKRSTEINSIDAEEYISTENSYFNFELNYYRNGYIISVKDKSNIPSDVRLPREYKGRPVTNIKYNGFVGCTSINSIFIPNSIISIEGSKVSNQGSFYGCTSLSVVVFQEKSRLENIGSFAFRNCIGLESIVIPRSIKRIGVGTFSFCSKLQQVYVESKSAPILGEKAFYKTSISLNIYVPSEKINHYKYCEGWYNYREYILRLPSITPSSLGFFDFVLNSDSKSYTIRAKNIGSLPSYLVIPSFYNQKPVTIIGTMAFAYAYNLNSVILPEELVIIDFLAFAFTNNIKEFRIPDSVEKIQVAAFAQTGLYSDNPPDIQKYGVSSLEKFVFGKNSKLSHIGEYAFLGCSKLKQFSIPMGVRYIGQYAFTAINIPYIFIPENVETIGEDAFYKAIYLKQITVDKSNKFLKDIDGVLFSKDGSTLVAYPLGKEVSSYSIPSEVKTILGKDAFYGCVNIRALYIDSLIPPSVRTSFMTALKGFKIYVPTDSFNVYKEAAGWGDISDIIYPKNIIKEEFAIYNNTLIQYIGNQNEIIIPEDVKEIKNFAFSSCVNLESISVSTNNDYLKSIEGVLFNADCTEVICYPQAKKEIHYKIPEGIKKLGRASFLGCKNLVSIEVPNSLEEVDDCAFYGCLNLKEVTIKNSRDSIKRVGKYAFYNCVLIEEIELNSIEVIGEYALSWISNLKKVTFGEDIKNIGTYLFYNSSMLAEIIIEALKPPTLGGAIPSSCNIYIPDESLELYKTAPLWYEYKDKIYSLNKKIIF